MEKTPKEGSNGVLEGVEYTVPDSDLTAFLSATSAKGKEAYTEARAAASVAIYVCSM